MTSRGGARSESEIPRWQLSYEPSNLLALRNLAFAYTQTGRPDEARELLERAVDVNPAQQDAQDQLRLLTDGQP